MNAMYLPTEKLRTKIQVYFNPEERQQVAAQSHAAGLALSAFIRRAALGQKVQSVPTVNIENYRALSRLGGNLNQLVHLIHCEKASGVDPLLIYEIGETVRLLRLDLTGHGGASS